jgi:hypothetical protein
MYEKLNTLLKKGASEEEVWKALFEGDFPITQQNMPVLRGGLDKIVKQNQCITFRDIGCSTGSGQKDNSFSITKKNPPGRPPRRPNNSQLEVVEKLMQKNPIMTIDELIVKTGFDHEAVRNVAEYLAREKGFELKRGKSHVLINTKAIENARARK